MNKFFAFLVAVFFHSQIDAQKIFSEGVIKYDVYVNQLDKPEGIYIVTVKNGFIKRELVMNSGFNNIIFYNHKTGITTSLNVDQGNKYALEMSAAEVQAKNSRFINAVFTPTNDKKKFAGYSSTSSKVQYTNGESALFYYTTDLLPPNESFNIMFPNLQGIPLEYEVKSNETTTIKFVATQVETKSIDSKIFDIPKDYKIVTQKELEQIK